MKSQNKENKVPNLKPIPTQQASKNINDLHWLLEELIENRKKKTI